MKTLSRAMIYSLLLRLPRAQELIKHPNNYNHQIYLNLIFLRKVLYKVQQMLCSSKCQNFQVQSKKLIKYLNKTKYPNLKLRRLSKFWWNWKMNWKMRQRRLNNASILMMMILSLKEWLEKLYIWSNNSIHKFQSLKY